MAPDVRGSGDSQGQSAPKASPLKEIQSEKTERLKKEKLVFANGKESEYWYVDNYLLGPDPSRVMVVDVATLAPGQELVGLFKERGNVTQSPGFPGLDWLNQKYYDKVVFIGEKEKLPCYHYVLKEKNGDVIVAEAWINATTGMPVRYTADGFSYTFSFDPVKVETLEMPPAYKQALAALERLRTRARLLESDAKKASSM